MANYRLDTVPIDVPSPEQLEATLVGLGLVSAGEWQLAVTEVTKLDGKANGQRILERLLETKSPSIVSTGNLTLITQYQADQIIHGQADKLKFGSYIILGELGAGGMGKVYRVLNTKGGLRRIEALKILHNVQSERIRSRFRKEMQALGHLRHPNVVQVYDVGESEGVDYFTMELVEGRTLEKLVEEKKPLSLDEVLVHIERVGEALHYAHKLGILHRDVKPQNIMVSQNDETKLLDLGIAQVRVGGNAESGLSSDLDRTQAGERFGTPMFMPPEQWSDAASVTPAADIYTLGGTLYYALTGQPPFDSARLLEAHVAHARPKVTDRRPDLPKEIDAIVAKSLAPSAKDRYQSAEEFVKELRNLRTSLVTKQESRRQQRWLLGAIVATAAVAVAAFFLIPMPAQNIWLPSDFQAVKGATLLEQGSRRLYSRIAPIEMPNATFILIPRSSPNDPASFYMMETEVSRGMLRHLMESMPADWSGRSADLSGDEGLPVANLTVTEADQVARELGGLLPTTRQWDKAAGRFDTDEPEKSLLARMSSEPESFALRRENPSNVGASPGDVAPSGCRDLAGNLAEWTRDSMSPDGYVPQPNANAQTLVTVRGLEYPDGPADLFSDVMSRALGYFEKDPRVGFRVVIEVDP